MVECFRMSYSHQDTLSLNQQAFSDNEEILLGHFQTIIMSKKINIDPPIF